LNLGVVLDFAVDYDDFGTELTPMAKVERYSLGPKASWFSL
jgi:hypothetical protein